MSTEQNKSLWDLIHQTGKLIIKMRNWPSKFPMFNLGTQFYNVQRFKVELLIQKLVLCKSFWWKVCNPCHILETLLFTDELFSYVFFFCNGKGFEYFRVTNLFRKKAKNSIALSFKCQKQWWTLLTSMQNGFGERLSRNYYYTTFQKFER